jgi:hypothetical protein
VYGFNPSTGLWQVATGGGGGTGTVTSIATTAPLTGGPITAAGTLGLANSGVTAGSYTNTNLTVDAFGRVTVASNGAAGGGGGTVTSLTAGAGITLTPNPITGAGTIAATGTGGAASVVPWNWQYSYNDPNLYVNRVLAVGYSGGLDIAYGGSITYPPGYRIPNGTNGGALASGAATAGMPIRCELVTAGTGVLKYASNMTATVVNTSTTATGTISMTLGTTASYPGGEPLYPYLGVSHANANPRVFTLGPNQTMQLVLMRLDVVDIALVPGIAGWPNWTQSIDTGTPTSLLYPAINPQVVTTGATFMITDIMIYGVAC